MQNFQGKNSVKTHAEFPWVLVFEFGISKGCHTILLNFQESKLVFSGISNGKVTNLKFPGGFQKIISPTSPVWFFSGIAQYVMLIYSLLKIHDTARSNKALNVARCKFLLWCSQIKCIGSIYGKGSALLFSKKYPPFQDQ